MIRMVIFLVAVGVAAFGVVWLADRPGDVAVTWQGYRIETSVMVTLIVVALIALVLMLLWSVLRFVMRVPRNVARARHRHKARRGQLAISRGLVAIGSGDARAARRFSTEALRAAPHDPLALLLRAQAAQMDGDKAAARQAFEAMARRGDTKLLGLRGLFIEAQRRDDAAAAQAIADEAAKAAPALPWAADATLEFRCAARDWDGALALLATNHKNGLLTKAAYRRQRAVLLTARALARSASDRVAAKEDAVEALKLAPGLVPAAALAGRLLAESGHGSRAGRVLEAAWKIEPHPELAAAYAQIQLSDSARERLARAQRLVSLQPGHVESSLALARAAIDAREFAAARRALEPLLAAPTQRVAVLMADLEQTESGDVGRAREWLARAVHAPRDPAWTADGIVSERWLPVSPVSGRIDAFVWRPPLGELAGPVVAPLPDAPVAPAIPPPDPEETSLPPPPLAVEGSAEPAASAGAAAPPVARVPPVIPLVHAPDDPGPDAATETEAPFVPPEEAQRRKLPGFFR